MAVAAYPAYRLYSPSWCASTLCAAAHTLVDLSIRSKAGHCTYTLYGMPAQPAWQPSPAHRTGIPQVLY